MPNYITRDKTAVFTVGGYQIEVHVCCLQDSPPPPSRKGTILELRVKLDPDELDRPREPLNLVGHWSGPPRENFILDQTKLAQVQTSSVPCSFNYQSWWPNTRDPPVPSTYLCMGRVVIDYYFAAWLKAIREPEGTPMYFPYTLYMDTALQASLGNNIDMKMFTDIVEMENKTAYDEYPALSKEGLATLKVKYNLVSTSDLNTKFETIMKELIVTGIGIKLICLCSNDTPWGNFE
jgi:hypothetical protein